MAVVNTSYTTHRTMQVIGSNPASFHNDLNSFFSRFVTDKAAKIALVISSLKPAEAESTFNMEDVMRALKRTKMKKRYLAQTTPVSVT